MDSVVKNLNDCVTVFGFLGHFYFSLKDISFNNRDRWPRLRHTIYFIFLLIFLLSSMILFAVAQKSTDYVKQVTAKSFLNLVLADITFAGLVLQIFVGLIQSYWTTPLSKRFFWNSLKIADKCQKDCQHLIDHKTIRDQLLRQTFILVVYFIGTGIFQYSIAKWHLKSSSAEIKNLTIICPITFLSTLSLKFIFHVRLINLHFEAVRTIVLKTFPKFPFAGVVKGVFVKPVKAELYRATTFKLQSILQVYLMIVENAELVNRSMGMTLFTVTAIQVISLITGTYRILMAALGKNPIENIAGPVYGLVVASIVMTSMVWYCHKNKKIVSFLEERNFI